MALKKEDVQLRHPIRTQRLGLYARLEMTDRDGHKVTLCFGSETYMRQWLVDATVQVLGYNKAEMVTGQDVRDVAADDERR